MIEFRSLNLADACFVFTATATTELYTLSLHDALPIWPACAVVPGAGRSSARPADRTSGPRASRHLPRGDRKSTRLNSSHSSISYAVFCLKKKNLIMLRNVLIYFDIETKLQTLGKIRKA